MSIKHQKKESIVKSKKFFETNFSSLQKDTSELLMSFEKREFKKKSIILKSNKIDSELRFVNKGLVREYYSSKEKDININFYESSKFITDFLSFYSKHPTKKYQECLTDVELLILPKRKFEYLINKYKKGSVFIESYFKLILRNNEKREFKMITMSPDELYKEILEKSPNWLQEIPQYHIASYLRVTPETLSRIRKRIS